MALSEVCRLDTKEEDVFCLCAARTGQEIKLFTGHSSLVKLWAPLLLPDAHSTPYSCQAIKLPVEGDVTCLRPSPVNEYHYLISVANSVLIYDTRDASKPLQSFQFNQDDINEIDVHPKGTHVLACDDSGQIQVLDLRSGSVFRTLTGGHSNICSSASFIPNRPWEVVSGGLDCKLVRWDLGRGKAIHEAAIEQSERGGYVVNPPMVHSLEAMPGTSLVVCGLGDGSVSVRSLAAGKGLDVTTVCQLHSAAVSQVRCLRISSGAGEEKLIIVSGGNDCQLVVSELVGKTPSSKQKAHKKAKSPDPMKLQLVTKARLDSKVNWMEVQSCVVTRDTATMATNSVYHVYVADQSNFVSIYQLTFS